MIFMIILYSKKKKYNRCRKSIHINSKNGVIALMDGKGSMDNLYEEMVSFRWDTQYWDTRRKKVLNKHARANVCFGENQQIADFENKKGTIIAYKNVPLLNTIHDSLEYYLGKKGEKLECEGNLYFDKTECGIGYHGDAERIKVAAVRIGSMPLAYQWFYNKRAVGRRFYIDLDDGDFYIMSEVATGNEWKKSSKPTLRHAAGCAFYTDMKKKHINNLNEIKKNNKINKQINEKLNQQINEKLNQQINEKLNQQINEKLNQQIILASSYDKDGKQRKSQNIKSGKCIFPFKYSRKLINKCIETKKGDKWCPTSVDKDQKMVTWGYCDINSKNEKIYTKNTDISGIKRKSKKLKLGECIFPFKYNKKNVDDCIQTKRGDKWCPTSLDKDQKMLTWGYCIE